jgi:hypothetical protein
MPNVVVASVPWQLNSSADLNPLNVQNAPGDVRRGFVE